MARYAEAASIGEVRAHQVLGIDKIQKSLQDMHRDVHGLVTASRSVKRQRTTAARM